MQIKRKNRVAAALLHLLTVLIMLAGMFMISPQDTASAVGAVIYIRANAGGSNNGTSWANAFTSFQSALSAAVEGDQIWVARGTYYPTMGTDRFATFALKNGVSVYGGFAGTENQLNQRNPLNNVTILSGDIGTPGSKGDNSYHVVSSIGLDNTAILDGFTITGGNANLLVMDGQDQYGGGLYNFNSSPTLSNLIFSGNSANYGAAMFNNASSPTVTDVTFRSNSASRGAGMYNTLGSNPVLNRVTFYSNSSVSRGGGMTNSASNPILTNVTFNANSAYYGGAMSNVGGSQPTLINVTISGNTVATIGGAMYNTEASNPVIINSILYGNSGVQIHNENGSAPVVSYSIVQGGYAGTGNLSSDPLLGTLANNGGSTQTMLLMPGSPAIDAGDNGNCPGVDQRGVSRPQGSRCDIGAYEKGSGGGGTPPATPTFVDVPVSHPYYQDIEILYANGLTAGCVTSPPKFCPDQIMDRAQSAVFMLRGSLGVSYTPPATASHIFADNWSPGLWAEKWAEGMYNEGMTAGCVASPLKFCPWDLTPREQAAIFGLRLKHGNNYQPPVATGTLFADMTDTSYYGTKWAEQAYLDGLIPNCGVDMVSGKPKFCPKDLVSRGLGALIIVRAKNLSMP